MAEKQARSHIILGKALIIFFILFFLSFIFLPLDDLDLGPFGVFIIFAIIGGVSLLAAYIGDHELLSSQEAHDETVKNFIKMEEKNTGSSDIKILCNANYYGGHKKYGEQTQATIILLENGWILTRETSGVKSFRIKIDPDTIQDFGITTKEQLTISRFLMVGILAFALKKKKKYLYIKYKDHLGFENNPVFDSMLGEIGIEEFSNILYDVLEKRKKQVLNHKKTQ